MTAVPAGERRGRWWLAVSFLACPCHLPLTLAVLGSVLGGTAVGALLRDNTLLAGTVIGLVWLAGTARGFVLIRRAQRGELACPVPARDPR
jgi:mercuric ion transport protein